MTGARILADYPDAMVRIACRKCDRRGQYWLATLMALYGEKAALPDVLRQLVHDCPKRGGIGNDSCGAYFPDLVERQGERDESLVDSILLAQEMELTSGGSRSRGGRS